MKKLFALFGRDLLSSRRDTMLIYILVFPLVFALAIALFAPGLNDTTVNLAVLEDEEAEYIAFIEKYAKVEKFPSIEELERRINKRDEIAGVLQYEDGHKILLQGNESDEVMRAAKALNALYDLDANKEETTAQLSDFGRTVPPLRTKLVNMLIMMVVMLSGMVIALGIVEEKQDNTINAVNVTPVSQNMFIVGKSLLGGIAALISIVLVLLITGYHDINWGMILLVGILSMILSLVVGFVQGVGSSDVIEAAGGVKLLMLPIAAGVVGYELIAEPWQWTMYWNPFYWAYKANDIILSKTAAWSTVLLCAGIVLVLSMIVYFLFMPKIRKGLS